METEFEKFSFGFLKAAASKSLKCLTPSELQQITGGPVEKIDWEEVEEMVTYQGMYFGQHPMIQQFWEMVKTYDEEQGRELLLFW